MYVLPGAHPCVLCKGGDFRPDSAITLRGRELSARGRRGAALQC
jgi:hypothetical protein